MNPRSMTLRERLERILLRSEGWMGQFATLQRDNLADVMAAIALLDEHWLNPNQDMCRCGLSDDETNDKHHALTPCPTPADFQAYADEMTRRGR